MYDRIWTVRFSDTDMHGIAHYPRIIDAIHDTADMYMESIGWPFWETQGEEGFGLPIVEEKFTFERPLHGGDEVVIELTPSLGNRSVRFEYEATVDGTVVFFGYEQRVCQAMGAASAMPLPDGLREAMEQSTD